MYRNGTLERSITQWLADEVMATDVRSDDPLVDHILTATGRLRPEPRWLALLKEPPMTVQSAVAVGTPSRRPILVLTLIALLALAAGAAVVGSNLINQKPRPTSAFQWRAAVPGGGFGPPGNIARDPKDYIWAPDNEHGKFAIFSPDGVYQESWGQPGIGDGFFNLKKASNGDGYGSIAFQPDGSFYVLDIGNFRIQQFDANRTFVRTWGSAGLDPLQYMDPTAITVGPDGTVYVLDDTRNVVEHLTRDGALIADISIAQVAGEPGFWTNGLTVDRDGNLYIGRADLPHRVEKLDPQGKHLLDFGVSAPGRLGEQANQVAFDGHGHVIVTQGPEHPASEAPILVYNADGTFLLGLGTTGTAEGQFTFPTGLAYDGKGDLYVSDPAVGGGSITKLELGPPLYP